MSLVRVTPLFLAVTGVLSFVLLLNILDNNTKSDGYLHHKIDERVVVSEVQSHSRDW